MPELSYVVTTSRRGGPELAARARAWAERLGVRFVPRADRSLTALCAEERIDAALTVTPVRVGLVIPTEGIEYFFHPGMARIRIRNIIEGKGDPMVTAMGLQPGECVLDCTLGRASDAIVAAWVVGPQGRVVGYEADLLVAALTIDGLRSYEIRGAGVQEAMRRIDARHGNCVDVLPELQADSFDVVYFDPFFEQTVADAQAMQSLRRIGVRSPIPAQTFTEARRVARRCVVVKQRRDGPPTGLPRPRTIVGGGGSSIEYAVLEAG
ncbi:MAG: class I SAM-dependent methyltransferase [Armatimonadota bacterium]